MLKNLISVAVASLLVAAFSSSAAPIVNGRFETGTFNGWSGGGDVFFGYAAVVDNSAGGPMIQGQYSALLVARDTFGGQPGYCAFDPWAGGCPPQIPFPSTPPPGPPLANPYPSDDQLNEEAIVPTRAESVLGQDFEAHAGDHLTLDWRWLSNDIPDPASTGDDAIFLIVSGETLVATAGYLLGRCGPAPTINGFFHHSTGCPVDLMVPFDGTWSLYVSVGNGHEDTIASSGVLIDNVRIRVVPEPGTLLLLLIGATGIAWARRRKQ